MKAIVQRRYGSPDILELQEVERPTPRAHEVLVQIQAASVNQADWFGLTGRPYAVRLAFGLWQPRHRIPGQDMAGRVVAIGESVQQFKPGDEVFGEVVGAYAEYVCAPVDRLGLKPTNLTFEQAAAVPLAGITALQGLRDSGGVRPGHRVLINGASGGVGTFAVQIARALGATVTAVCSTGNLEQARMLGAEQVIDYTREDFTRCGSQFDTILDIAGSRPLSACRRLLAPQGVYVSVCGRLRWVATVALTSLIAGRQVKLLSAQPRPDDLARLRQLIEAGQLTPVITRRYPLAEVAEALRWQGLGHAQGKTVITI